MTADISRHSLRPEQKFTAVVRQQGRLPIDAEETEAGDIANLLLRQAISETLCARGSPNQGFRISDPVVDAGANPPTLDFSIAAGSFYLCGARCSTPGMIYRDQPDWLAFDIDNPGPTVPAGGVERTDLIWLQAWEQTVTAAEDSELFERALGGADSGARRRIVQRVRVLEDVPDNCPDAFADLVNREFVGGTLDEEGCEVLSDCRLQIGFTQLEPLQDLCRPSAQAGFLGARNETFRVQVTTPGRFVWGRDNAAPVYRVQVEDDEDGNRRRLRFLNLPRDEFGWPLAGMTVELLRWGVFLENTEKVAEPNGLLLRVEAGFDPSDDSIVVDADVPADWEAWLAAATELNPRDEAGSERYFFMRVWTGGGEGAAVDHAIDLINPVPLGETGLTANFSSPGMPGDYWIVSARPNTPTEVTPWALLDGAPPAGPKRLLAPLALLPWSGPNPGTPIDCRHRFRSLCRNTGCCVIVVGDERESHGDVDSIQAAVELLPDTGGTICVLPGRYEENVLIRGRRDIRIHGCDARSRLIAATDENDAPLPAIRIEDSLDICVEKLGIESGPRSAVEIRGSLRIALRHLVVQMRDLPSIHTSVFASGEHLLIEHCLFDILAQTNPAAAIPIEVLDGPCDGADPAPPPVIAHAARGGIQIGGGSEFVQIRDNAIRGGVGHGIVLGSLIIIGENGQPEDVPDEPGSFDPCDPCRPVDTGGGDDGSGINIRSAGDLYEIEITRNRIEAMGGNGISAVRFFALRRRPILVTMRGLLIDHNRIVGCLRRHVAQAPAALLPFLGYGGVALAFATDFRLLDNEIRRNGASHIDPVCGLFAIALQNAEIARNRILDNGPREAGQPSSAAHDGARGGIWNWLALPSLDDDDEDSDPRFAALTGVRSLTVHDNSIGVPLGRTLTAMALGEVSISRNRMLSEDSTVEGLDLLATNVLLLNFGISNEWTLGLLWFTVVQLFYGKTPIADFSPCQVAKLLGLFSGNNQIVQPPMSRFWATGKTLISNNQISTRCIDEGFDFALSSMLAASLDDLGIHANQFEIESRQRFFITDLVAIAGSVRVADNRLSETWLRAFWSGLSLGLMNTTTDNQATHCLLASALLPNMRVFRDNLSLISAFCPEECRRGGDQG